MSGSITGLDGKTYPNAWLPADDRRALIRIVHQLHCGERLSVRKLLDQIDVEHGIRRSTGWAAGVLKNQQCSHCSGDPPGSPEQFPDLRDDAPDITHQGGGVSRRKNTRPFVAPDGVVREWLRMRDDQPLIEPDRAGAMLLLEAATMADDAEKAAAFDRILQERPALPLLSGLIHFNLVFAYGVYGDNLNTLFSRGALIYSAEDHLHDLDLDLDEEGADR